MNTKKYGFTAALAALLLTGAVSGWMRPAHTSTNYGPVFTGMEGAMDSDGFPCLDTKFFLPLRAGGYLTATTEQEHREALLAVLASHERR